jgi:pimeloyl-ACP methyl ester carboxylesterase
MPNHALTLSERQQISAANASGLPSVVFVHGLWALPSSWDAWRSYFEARGFTTLAPSWPNDPTTVDEARAHPELLAGNGIGSVTYHIADVIRQLDRKPAIVGHSFGGLITEKLAGMGLASASVAIDPAPIKGVLPLSFSAFRGSLPVLGNPANVNRTVMLTYRQFRYSWANALSEAEAKALYDRYHVPCPGKPLFQAALASVTPNSEAAADTRNPARGPMKIISGERDHLVPWSVANAAYKKEKANRAPTEIQELPDRGHSLTIDSGWEEVAEAARTFIDRYLH